MNINNDLDTIISYAHFWNWSADWNIIKNIYNTFPDSYSVLTPFAYSYLEELIRSTTSQYGIEIVNSDNKPKYRKTGIALIKLAIKENSTNTEYINKLKIISHYFQNSSIYDRGNNRNSTVHGYMHPRFWTKESFEELIHNIAIISKYSNF